MSFDRPPTPEAPSLTEHLRTYLAHHVVDHPPGRSGDRSALADIAGSAFGCNRVEVARCHPPLRTEAIRLIPGKSIVLIGPNGSGKTTFFDAIMDTRGAMLDPGDQNGGVVYGESVHHQKKLRISRLNQEELLEGIKETRADKILEAFKTMCQERFPVDWEKDEAYEQNLLNQDANQRIEELAGKLQSLFEMEDFLARPVKDLSGGERTKLALCLVFMSEPDVVLLDEPTNHLDVESLAKLSGLIKLYTSAGVSVLSVSHVDSYLREAGKDGVVEIKVTKDERHATSSASPYAAYVKNRARAPYSIIRDPLPWSPTVSSNPSGALLSLKSSTTTIPNSPLANIAIPSLLPRDVWVLSGKNGTGKTKLMETMAHAETLRDMERGKGVVAYLPQFWPEDVAKGSLENFYFWVRDSINRHASHLGTKQLIDIARTVGFQGQQTGANFSRDAFKKPLSTFSGGEQRVLWFLITGSMDKVDALFLDEPTNHMDQKQQEWVTKAMQDFPGALVFSTHDLRLLDAFEKSVGNKGSTVAPKNLVLEKKNGASRLIESPINPAAYMRQTTEAAFKAAARLKLA